MRLSHGAARRKLVATHWQGAAEQPLKRESALFCPVSNVPFRIKRRSSLKPSCGPREESTTIRRQFNSPCTSQQTCGGRPLRPLQGFIDLLGHFWPPASSVTSWLMKAKQVNQQLIKRKLLSLNLLDHLSVRLDSSTISLKSKYMIISSKTIVRYRRWKQLWCK